MLWLGRCGRHLARAQAASGHCAWLSTVQRGGKDRERRLGKCQGGKEDTGRFRSIIGKSHQQFPANAVLRLEIVGARELLSHSSMWGLGSINPSVHIRMGQRDVDKGMWTEATTTQLESKPNPVGEPPKKELFRSIVSYWMQQRLSKKICVSLILSLPPSLPLSLSLSLSLFFVPTLTHSLD
jgi:hypothetical protein